MKHKTLIFLLTFKMPAASKIKIHKRNYSETIPRPLWYINTRRNLNATCKYQMTFTKHIPCLILLWANVVITNFILSNKITIEDTAVRKISVIGEKPQRITEVITNSDTKFRGLTDCSLSFLRMNERSWHLCRINIHSIYAHICISAYLYIHLLWDSVWHIE